MLKSRDIIILVIAIACGAVAFVIVSNILSQSAKPKQSYVIAAKAIEPAQVIALEDLVLSKPMEGADASDLFLQVQDVVGNEAMELIGSGQLVRRSKVRRPIQFVATPEPEVVIPVPAGKRALAIAWSELDSPPSGLMPGGYLDILGMVLNPDGSRAVRTIIRGCQILSIEKGGPGGQPKSLTVALTGSGTEVIARALTRGKLRLVAVANDANAGVVQEQESIELIRGVEKEVVNRGAQQQGQRTN